jgi:DUF1009 family protein
MNGARLPAEGLDKPAGIRSPELNEKSALIAGEGALPVEIARRLAHRGIPPLVLTLRGDADAFHGISDPLISMRCPALGRAIREIRRHGARNVIMAGYISKKFIYLPALFDPLTLKILARSARDDHSLLAGVVSAFESEGIPVVPYWQILPEFLARQGRLGHRSPTAEEIRDVERGSAILKTLLPCSFGQSLVIADGAVVAVEAMEGTDGMIRRAGELITGRVKKGVVVKMMRVDQDIRYDLPTVGPETIENMARSGLSCLAVESGRTLIVDAGETLALAERRDIAMWGLPCQSS